MLQLADEGGTLLQKSASEGTKDPGRDGPSIHGQAVRFRLDQPLLDNLPHRQAECPCRTKLIGSRESGARDVAGTQQEGRLMPKTTLNHANMLQVANSMLQVMHILQGSTVRPS
jgi:hypothetical protein